MDKKLYQKLISGMLELPREVRVSKIISFLDIKLISISDRTPGNVTTTMVSNIAQAKPGWVSAPVEMAIYEEIMFVLSHICPEFQPTFTEFFDHEYNPRNKAA